MDGLFCIHVRKALFPKNRFFLKKRLHIPFATVYYAEEDTIPSTQFTSIRT